MDFEDIEKVWKFEGKKYAELGSKISQFITKEISSYEILPEISFRTKDLISIVKKIKKKQIDNPSYSLNDLKDKLGIRIICAFSTDLEIVDKFLNDNFIIVKPDYKRESLDFNRLDYTSNHYDVKIKIDNHKLKFKTDKFSDLIFEIQVRSLNQHAWSNAAHILTYKSESNISDKLKRRVYRLLSLYEIADDEFSAVNNALTQQDNNVIYTLLRKLEPKIYKYAGIDYDRETSIIYLKKILGEMNNAQIEAIKRDILTFINCNDKKIVNIFESNRDRYFEIPFLTQPEIFITWYALENFPFKIEEIYANEISEDELDQVKSIWA